MSPERASSRIAKRPFRSRALAVVLVFFLSCALIESIVRLAGHRAWPSGQPARAHQLDSLLGWTKAPGRFDREFFGRPHVATHWAGNLRATGTERRRRSRRIILVGDSFTYGYGLNDDETFAWRLQAAYPEIEWLNYGTNNYGTYQALLSLEHYFERDPVIPEAVIYGFLDFHEARNVAAASSQYWMARFSPSERLRVPYVALSEDGSLERRVHTYPNWPLKRHFAAMALAERAYNRLQIQRRSRSGVEVTRQLLVAMDGSVRKRGSRLVVVMLGASRYGGFLAERGIPAVDCRLPKMTPEMTLPDGHPSAKRNAVYAQCLGSYLEGEGLLDRDRQSTASAALQESRRGVSW